MAAINHSNDLPTRMLLLRPLVFCSADWPTRLSARHFYISRDKYVVALVGDISFDWLLSMKSRYDRRGISADALS